VLEISTTFIAAMATDLGRERLSVSIVHRATDLLFEGKCTKVALLPESQHDLRIASDFRKTRGAKEHQ
jgi:hypothetical protein